MDFPELSRRFALIATRGLLVIAVGLGCLSCSNPNARQDDDSSSRTSPSSKKDCSSLEPHNPYGAGTGHYAGYKWGEDGKACGGNSTSFVEGCEAHEAQQEAYEACTRQ